MRSGQFDQDYTQYWNKETLHPDSRGVPTPQTAIETLELLFHGSRPRFEKSLDVGCGSGRMQEVVAAVSEGTWGLELEESAAQKARTSGYTKVWQAPGESVPTTPNFFDFIFCWAVFEVLDQTRALIEFNRILRPGGLALITGKNSRHLADDSEAVAAEQGARGKGFLQSFTNLQMLLDSIGVFGFEFRSAITFARRGNFGRLRHSTTEKFSPENEHYEFAMLIHKVSEPHVGAGLSTSWWSSTSENYRLAATSASEGED